MKQRRRKYFEFLKCNILLKNQSFMKKLFVFSSLLVILPVFSVGFISYQRSAAELEEEVRQSSSQVIDQVRAHIEYYVQDFEIASLRIINSPEMNAFINFNITKEENNVDFDESVRNLFTTQKYSRPDISNITILSNDGKVIDTLGHQNYYPATNIQEEYWYSSVPQNGMILLVSRTLKLKDKELPVISLVRRIHNPRTLQPVGMLIIDINFSRIEEILKKVTIRNNGYFFILDTKEHYVYHPDYSKLGYKVEIEQIAKLKEQDSGSKILENETRDFVTYTHSSALGWTFFTSVQYRNLTEGIKQIGKTIILTVSISLLFAYLMGYGFATTLIRPIRRLQQFMKEVEVGKLDGRVPVESNDEMGQLTAGFNNTVEKLSNLLEEVYVSKINEVEMSLKQKEIELKMLQSQMNPHFLYNSLETIRGMALEENQENIANMSYALGLLLRYNLKNCSSTVSLGEELRFCEMYLKIQKFRFEDRFEYTFDIPQWAMELKVVKFSLQPIIENCFVHAVGQNIKKMKIVISLSRATESTFTILISDTGAGIPEDVLTELTNRLQRMTTTNDGQSIGIINVHQRIYYLFGSEYGITIRSKQGVGTEVEMNLPVMIESEDGEIG